MRPTLADANLGPISVCLVSKHSVCLSTNPSHFSHCCCCCCRCSGQCSEVNGFDCDSLPENEVSSCSRCHSIRLGLYLTAHALTIHDRGFSSLCMLTRMMMMMIIWLDHSLTYLLLPEVKWASIKQLLPSISRNICLMMAFIKLILCEAHTLINY